MREFAPHGVFANSFKVFTLCISLVLLFHSSPIRSQNAEIDSLQQLLDGSPADTNRIDILLNLTTALYRANEPAKAIQVDSQAIELSQQLNYSQGEGDAYHKLGIIKLRAAEYDEAIQLFEEALKIRTSDNDLKRMSYTNINMGVIFMTLNDYEKADYHYQKALSIGKILNDTVSIGGAYINLGIISMELAKYDTAIFRLEKGIELYEIIDAKRGAGDGYNCLGGVYQDIGEYDKAQLNYRKAISFYEQVDNFRGISAATLNIGNIYRKQGNFPKALEAYQKSLDIKIETNDKKGQAILLRNIGLLYESHGEYEKTLENLEKSLVIFKEIQIPTRIGQTYTYLAGTYTILGEFDKAYDNYIRGLEILESSSYPKIEAQVLNGLGTVKLAQNEPEEAKTFFERALEKGVGIELITGETYEGLALSNLALKKYKRAKSAAIKGYEISQSLGILELNQSFSNVLSQVLANQGEFKKAYNYQVLYKQYSDSLFNSENIKKITQLELEYAFNQEKKQLLAEQEKNDLVVQNELKRRKIIQYSFLGGGILFLLLFLTSYNSYRRKKKANEIIQDQNRNISMAAAKLKASNERLSELSSLKDGLNHMIANDMKSSLEAILNDTREEASEGNMRKIDRTGTLVLNLVTNMLDVQAFEENNTKLDRKKCSLLDIVDDAISQTKILSDLKHLIIELKVQDESYLNADRQVLVRILVNLLVHAIENSEENKLVTLSSTQDDRSTFISVANEGQVISENETRRYFDRDWELDSESPNKTASTGLGLTFCKMAIEAHKGIIDVSSSNAETTITIQIPNR